MSDGCHRSPARGQGAEGVVVTAPVYPPFYSFTRSAGRAVIEAPLGPDGRLDLDALDSALATVRHLPAILRQAIQRMGDAARTLGRVA